MIVCLFYRGFLQQPSSMPFLLTCSKFRAYFGWLLGSLASIMLRCSQYDAFIAKNVINPQEFRSLTERWPGFVVSCQHQSRSFLCLSSDVPGTGTWCLGHQLVRTFGVSKTAPPFVLSEKWAPLMPTRSLTDKGAPGHRRHVLSENWAPRTRTHVLSENWSSGQGADV